MQHENQPPDNVSLDRIENLLEGQAHPFVRNAYLKTIQLFEDHFRAGGVDDDQMIDKLAMSFNAIHYTIWLSCPDMVRLQTGLPTTETAFANLIGVSRGTLYQYRSKYPFIKSVTFDNIFDVQKFFESVSADIAIKIYSEALGNGKDSFKYAQLAMRLAGHLADKKEVEISWEQRLKNEFGGGSDD